MYHLEGIITLLIVYAIGTLLPIKFQLWVSFNYNIFFSPFVCLMSHCIRKPTNCLGENKGADQLRGDREADQRLYFRYTDSAIPLLLKCELSSF